MNQKIYKPITKCLLCGTVFEPKIDSTSAEALETYKYLHQCDARFESRRGLGKLIGFTIEKAFEERPERISTLNEPNRIQDLEDTLKPETG